MTSTERGTPRTDNAVKKGTLSGRSLGSMGGNYFQDGEFTSADFARALELDLHRTQEERDAARRQAYEYQKTGIRLGMDLQDAEDALTAARQEAEQRGREVQSQEPR